MVKCDVCGEYVNLKKNHVYYHKEKKDGTMSKRRTYEHVKCSKILYAD